MSKRNLPYYYRTSGALNVKTNNFKFDFKDVKNEVISMDSSHIHTVVNYPNGLIVETKVNSGLVEFWSNYRIILNSDCELIFDL